MFLTAIKLNLHILRIRRDERSTFAAEITIEMWGSSKYAMSCKGK